MKKQQKIKIPELDLKILTKAVKIKKKGYEINEKIVVPTEIRESILKEVEEMKKKDDIETIKKVISDVSKTIELYYYKPNINHLR